jgi:hypothetical protein
MTYKKLTVFNYKTAYYVMRVFGLYWLLMQYLTFRRISNWPKEIYEPFFTIQKIIFPEYPGEILYGCLLSVCALLLIITLFKQNYILNFLIFVLIAIINFPISLNFSVGHNNHLIIIGFFMAIFLLPKNLTKENDYKWIQYFYLGILATYSMAGISKFLGISKNIIKQTGKITWLDKNAAKINTLDNYWMADIKVPDWILNLYAYENFWVFTTVFGIVVQASSFLGSFNRKYLTCIMIFLYIFHWYTDYFVLADFKDAKNFILVALFPYHIFYPLYLKFKSKFQYK